MGEWGGGGGGGGGGGWGGGGEGGVGWKKTLLARPNIRHPYPYIRHATLL